MFLFFLLNYHCKYVCRLFRVLMNVSSESEKQARDTPYIFQRIIMRARIRITGRRNNYGVQKTTRGFRP